MTCLTVVRQAPRLVIGSCGVHPDRDFESFESDLDWLELHGVLLERLEPSAIGPLLDGCPEAAQVWQAAGPSALPLIVAGGRVLSRGYVPTRHALAHLVAPLLRGCTVDALRRVADLAAATALGSDDERARARARAEDAGFDATRLDAVEEEVTRFAQHLRTSN